MLASLLLKSLDFTKQFFSLLLKVNLLFCFSEISISDLLPKSDVK